MHLKLLSEEKKSSAKNLTEQAYRFMSLMQVFETKFGVKLQYSTFILQNVVHRNSTMQTVSNRDGIKERIYKYSAALHVVRKSSLTNQKKKKMKSKKLLSQAALLCVS